MKNQKTRASAFKEAFNNLAYKYGGHKVWRDFVTMAACSLSGLSGGDHFEERERMYLESASHYKAEELDGFSAMMACTILAINENPEQDFLGSLYGELRLINRSAEQFFTPYCIATLMARVALPPLEKGKSISDPCCGAGALLLAAANEAKRNGMNVGTDLLFVGQDIDFVPAMMAYIQLSLMGCNAIIKVGDSLSNPFLEGENGNNVWRTHANTRKERTRA